MVVSYFYSGLVTDQNSDPSGFLFFKKFLAIYRWVLSTYMVSCNWFINKISLSFCPEDVGNYRTSLNLHVLIFFLLFLSSCNLWLVSSIVAILCCLGSSRSNTSPFPFHSIQFALYILLYATIKLLTFQNRQSNNQSLSLSLSLSLCIERASKLYWKKKKNAKSSELTILFSWWYL